MPVEGEVSLDAELEDAAQVFVKGPNFDIDIDIATSNSLVYKTWDDLLSNNTATSAKILENSLSGSFSDSIELDNINYSNYDSFIHFGSAVERLKNFKYKLQLVEQYEYQIALVSASTAGDYTGRSESLLTYNKFVDRKQLDPCILE